MDSAYTAARIHAMRTKIVRDYEKLLRMSDKEVIGYLQSTDYRKDVDDLQVKDLYSLDVVDRILAKNADRTIEKLARISSEEFRAVLDGVLEENDRWNLMVVAEAITGGKDAEQTLASYGRRGKIEPGEFAQAKDLKELARMAHRHFPDVPEETDDLSSFLHSLARSGEGLHPYIIDEKNILSIIRAKREGVQATLIRGGTTGRALLRGANEAGDVREALRMLQETRYGDAIKAVLEEDSLASLEKRLHGAVIRQIRNRTRKDPLGTDVMQHYLAEKDIEHQNIRLLVKAKRLGLQEDFVREHLIT